MERGWRVAKVVEDVNNEFIAKSDIYGGRGKLTVDGYDRTYEAVRACADPSNVKVVGNNFSCSYLAVAK